MNSKHGEMVPASHLAQVTSSLFGNETQAFLNQSAFPTLKSLLHAFEERFRSVGRCFGFVENGLKCNNSNTALLEHNAPCCFYCVTVNG